MSTQRRIFPDTFKREAVDRVATSGLSVGAVAPSPSDLVADNARLRRENDRLRMERDILKTYGPPRPQGVILDGVSGLQQRIRSQGPALAKMDIRASRVLIKASVTSTAFRTRISSPPV